jgi:hypothetical protein
MRRARFASDRVDMSKSTLCQWKLPFAIKVAVICEAARNGTGSPSRTAAMFLSRYLERPHRGRM